MMGLISILHSTGHGCQALTEPLKPHSGPRSQTPVLRTDIASVLAFHSAFVLSFSSGSWKPPVLSCKLTYAFKKICVTLYPDVL